MTKSDLKSAHIDKADTKLSKLNHVSACWKALFDINPDIPLQFTRNMQNQLLLDGIVIDDISHISTDNAEYDIEHFYFKSTAHAGWFYRVSINWDFEDHIRIQEISLVLHSSVA